MALLAVVVLLQMVDIFERGEDFVERGMGARDIGYYAWLRLPLMLQQALPIAALAGATGDLRGPRPQPRDRRDPRRRRLAVADADDGAARAAAAVGRGLAARRADRAAKPAPLRALVGRRRSRRGRAPPPRARWFRIGARRGPGRAGVATDGRRLTGVDIFRRDARGLLHRAAVRRAPRPQVADGWALSDVETQPFDSGGVRRQHAAERALGGRRCAPPTSRPSSRRRRPFRPTRRAGRWPSWRR